MTTGEPFTTGQIRDFLDERIIGGGDLFDRWLAEVFASSWREGWDQAGGVPPARSVPCDHERAAERLAQATMLTGDTALTLLNGIAALVDPPPSAEDITEAIEGAIPDDLPGYRDVYTERAVSRVMALLTDGTR